MNHDPLDDMLASYATRTRPTTTGPSQAEVWREIDRRRQLSIWTRMFSVLDVRELFTEPRLAVVAIAFAVVVGMVPAFVVSRAQIERQLSRQSIHFEVFSPDSGSFGSVLAKPIAMTSSLKP